LGPSAISRRSKQSRALSSRDCVSATAGRSWRVQQIENDPLGYNEDNIFGATIDQFSFNFDAMLERASMPTAYPKSAPEEIDDEDDRVDERFLALACPPFDAPSLLNATAA
jgi:hypothetical protein